MIEQVSNKTALVTGGTDGVGKEIARALARLGARVIIVGRDAGKGVRAEGELRSSTKNGNVEFIRADLSLVREAERLADELGDRFPTINYLVHSAGVVLGRRVLTSEGLEFNFATNYLSRFALTVRLLSALQMDAHSGRSARIVLISHPGFDGAIYYEDVNLTKNFSTIRAFRQFHYANDLFAVELARRLALRGRPSVTIACLHPGPTKNTNIHKEMPLWMKLFLRLAIHPFVSHTPEVPAQATLKLLLADELEGESGGLFSMLGKFKRLAPSPNLQDPKESSRFWTFSENLVRSAGVIDPTFSSTET
jgi:NAD(P)-dependent dehydrogenase (short-subunit alcohol dehydrogenase family)